MDCNFKASGGDCVPSEALADGEVTLKASVADMAGNTASAQIQFTVDAEPVEINILSPSEGFITPTQS